MGDLYTGPTSGAPSLEGLADEEKISAIIEWFFLNFEDPAHNTPHDSAEGGYQYIWGGPYDAADELHGAFGDQASEDLIEVAATRVRDQDGIWDWAPSDGRILDEEDYDPVAAGDIVDGDDDWPPLIVVPKGSREVRTAAVLDRLNKLENALKKLGLSAATIGHNNPPEPIDDFPLSVSGAQQLQVTINIVRSEVRSPDPDVKVVEKSGGYFKKVAHKLAEWISKTTDKLVVAGLTAVASNYYSPIVDALRLAYQAIRAWLM